MNTTSKKYNFYQRFRRQFKLNFIKLFRSPGGAKKVSLGFAIGFGLEMIVLSSVSMVYLFFVPLVRLVKGSLPAAVIGNVIGKLTFLPVLLMPLAKKIGKFIYPIKVHAGHSPFSFSSILHGNFKGLIHVLYGGIHVLIGMTVFGMILGGISYFIIHYLYEKEKARRLTKKSGTRPLVSIG